MHSMIGQYLLLIKINKNFRNFQLTDFNIFNTPCILLYILYIAYIYLHILILQYNNKNKYFIELKKLRFQGIQSIETSNKNIIKHPINL